MHQADVEKSVLKSSGVLYLDPSAAAAKLTPLETTVDHHAAAMLEGLRALYALDAQRLNTQPVYDPPMTAEEKQAASLVVECTGTASYAGCQTAGGRGAAGGRGGVGGGRGAAPGGRGSGPSLPQHMNAEFTILLGKRMTALQIRDFLSGEFEPVPLADVMAVLHARESAGSIKLVPR
jgi:hypothetical protein